MSANSAFEKIVSVDISYFFLLRVTKCADKLRSKDLMYRGYGRCEI